MSGKKLLLPAAGAAVLIAGGAAAYWYFKGPAVDGTTPLAIAKTIPDEAYMTAFVSSDLKTWAKLQEFGTPEAKDAVTKALASVDQDLLSKNQISFDKDIRPWLGNGMIALLPSGKDSTQPEILAVFSIRDKVSALQFAGKLASQGGKGTETEYKGTKIFVSEDGQTHATVVNDFLMVGSSQPTIEAAINTNQGEPSLASKPEAETLFTKGVDLKNAIAYVYMPDYAGSMEQLINAAGEDAPDTDLSQLKNIQSVVAGIGVDDAGIRMKAIANMSPNAPKFDYQPVPGKVISRFPSDVILMISGGNLNRIWTQAVEQIKTDQTAQQGLDEMRKAAQTINIDLDKDVFSWMDGEFGMAMIPSDRGILAQVGFGSVLVFNTSNRQTAEATLTKLDDFAKSNSIAVQKRDVQGKQVTEWNTPMVQGALLGHGWLDDSSLFVAFGGPMVEVITSQPNPALDANPNFKAATGNLSSKNLGYFYLDMDKTMALVNRFAALSGQDAIPPEPLAIANSIKGIGMTSSQMDGSTGQMDMIVALKKSQ